LFAELGSFSLPMTVAVLVMQVKPDVGAVPVRVATNVPPSFRTPSEQRRLLPVTTQPAVVVATLVTPAGTSSKTEKNELLPGPWFVTVSVQVMEPPGETSAGPVLDIPKSTFAVPVHAAPSLLVPATGPVKLPISAKVGALPDALAIAIM
jgi:hypothetical protein